ncbi:MAG: hypothetical protein QW764_03835 [Desulfurococcaceae archaeon]
MVLNLGNNSLRNPKTIAILKELARNPRVSIRFLSLKLGINYLTARHRVLSLLRKNKISFGLLVSADIVGREVALVRIKTDNPDYLSAALSSCARVLLTIRTGNDEVLVIMRGRSKHEISFIVESLRKNLGESIREFSIDYGALHQDALVIYKSNHVIDNNGELDCDPEHMCENCIRLA